MERAFRHYEIYLSDDRAVVFISPNVAGILACYRHGGQSSNGPDSERGFSVRAAATAAQLPGRRLGAALLAAPSNRSTSHWRQEERASRASNARHLLTVLFAIAASTSGGYRL
jgi:Mg-chelatase subunit ChlD